MKRVLGLALCAALVSVVFISVATAGGNSPSAKKCQKGGWTTLVRADQTPFASEKECTSYAAKGGTLSTPSYTASRAVCESLGGTLGPAAGISPGGLWNCNGWQVGGDGSYEQWVLDSDRLSAACGVDVAPRTPGLESGIVSENTYDSTCH